MLRQNSGLIAHQHHQPTGVPGPPCLQLGFGRDLDVQNDVLVTVVLGLFVAFGRIGSQNANRSIIHKPVLQVCDAQKTPLPQVQSWYLQN